MWSLLKLAHHQDSGRAPEAIATKALHYTLSP